jgi:8-oxo-dGTP pyrophosphatase MutT (NUDIX family)
MIKHGTAGGFVFCQFPGGGWRTGLVEHPRMEVRACPGGHVEDDETAAEAAIREIEEETGLKDVRLLGFPAPALPAGFPDTHALVPLPWWITEIGVPADNHLAEPHVHVDHMWVAVAADARPAVEPAHPFAWYAERELEGLPMFEDTRILLPRLFACMNGIGGDGEVTGDRVLAALGGR